MKVVFAALAVFVGLSAAGKDLSFLSLSCICKSNAIVVRKTETINMNNDQKSYKFKLRWNEMKLQNFAFESFTLYHWSIYEDIN